MVGQTRRDTLRTLGGSIGVVTVAGCVGDDDEGLTGEVSGERVPELEFLTATASDGPIAYEYSTRIVEAWEELGFNIDHVPMEADTRIGQAIGEHDYQVWQVGWGGAPDRIDPHFFIYSCYHSDETDPGAFNFALYENEEYDELAEQQMATFEYEERREIVHECLEILDRDQPRSTPFSPQIADPYLSDRVSGYTEMPGQYSSSFMNVMNVELSGEDTFRIGGAGHPETLNPLATTTIANRDAQRLIYDRLFRINPDFEPEPWAVESYEQVDDTTVEMTIRDGMTFHDGTDVTVDDFVFSIEYQQEHGLISAGLLSPIERVEALDEEVIQLELERPYAPIYNNAFAYAFLLPEHIWEEIPDTVDVEAPADWPNPEPIGSGPFEFESFEQDEELRLSRFDDFYRPPNIEALIWVTGPQGSMYDLVETEEIDAMVAGQNHAPDTTDRLRELEHIEIHEVGNHGVQDVTYNNSIAPFTDRAVRKALDYAIPRTEIVEEVYLGLATAEYSHITSANERWHNPDIEQHGGDMDRARQELEDAGYEWDSDGNLHYPEG